MKALYYNGSGIEYREDTPVPVPGEGEGLVRIRLANICSTDREILKGYRPDFRGIMGHEFVGEVVESAGRPELKGRLVVGELNRGCGKCIYCRTGREKHCLSRQVIGMSRDGCFAEYMTLADHLLHEVPAGLAPEEAVYTEPLAAAVEITSQVHIDPSLNAAVIGDGRLGFMIAQVLAQTGIDLTVIGRHPDKLQLFSPFARTELESAYYEDVYDDQVWAYRSLRPLTAEECFEYVVDASGAPSGFELALGIVRKMGTLILKSTYAGGTVVDLSVIPVNEITVVGSRCGPFEPALKLLKEGRVQFPPVDLYPLEAYEEAFASGAFKAGFTM